jgi:hypothetical protein
MDNIIIAFVSSIGILFTVIKIIGWRATMHYETVLDVLFTIGIPCLLAGSERGMIIGILSGIFFSIKLFVLKKLWRTIYDSDHKRKKESR